VSIYHKSSEEVHSEMQEIEKARENPRAFSVLYKRYYRPVFLFVYRRLADKEDTQDIVSQVFVKALTNLPTYQHRGLPFSSWLFRIASNEVNLFFRNGKKIRSISLETAGVHKIQAETDLPKLDTYLLSSILNLLEEEDVELLEMRYFENISIKEVAEIKDWTESNVKVKTFRLIEKIKKLVLEKGIGNEE
jgi:RNA polymerase sigma-70 factor, ECF subfamily